MSSELQADLSQPHDIGRAKLEEDKDAKAYTVRCLEI